MTKQATHTPGPGLKVLSKARWYGGGYCSICGHRGDALIARQVRYWDPDDGWRVGVLCSYCGEETAERGPRKGDYAYREAAEGAMKADVLASMGDEDATYTETM